jgi:hypothetical protein
MSVNVIEKRQNEKRMLRYQYASRSHYNRAETLNTLVWVCFIISWWSIFLPDSYNSNLETLKITVLFFVNIIAVILNCLMNFNVSVASTLRKYFDAYVLDLNIDQFTAPEVQKLEELSIKAVNHSPGKSKVQMSNTGHDNPPGVRNWYEFSQPLSEQDAIYECQKQNCWWNNRIMVKRLIFTGIGLLVFISLVIFFIIKTNIGILQAIFSSSGLIIKCAERLVVNAKYYRISLRIDGALDVLTNSRSDENIKNLQGEIDERRAMPVLEWNHFHKRHAKENSELYHDITTVAK